jgi:endonuclease G
VVTGLLLALTVSLAAGPIRAEMEDRVLYGIPRMPSHWRGKVLHYDHYSMFFDQDLKMPRWVAFRQDAHTQSETFIDDMEYVFDPLLERAEQLGPEDYHGAYERERLESVALAPVAKNLNRSNVWPCSFWSNLVPMRTNLLRGPWMILERNLRSLTQTQTVWVWVGPLFEHAMPSLPESQKSHQVPSGFWKICLGFSEGQGAESEPEVFSFILEQSDAQVDGYFTRYYVPVAVIERRSGLDLFPDLPETRRGELKHRNSVAKVADHYLREVAGELAEWQVKRDMEQP